MKIFALLFLSFFSFLATATPKQILDCTQSNQSMWPYTFKAEFQAFKNGNIRTKTILNETSNKHNRQSLNVLLETVSFNFSNKKQESVRFENAEFVKWTGENDDADLNYDQYRFQLPIQYWQNSASNVPVAGFFVDTFFKIGWNINFICSSRIVP